MIPGHACIVYPPLQKNVRTPVHEYAGGPFEARLAPWNIDSTEVALFARSAISRGEPVEYSPRSRSTRQAKEGAPAYSAEEMKHVTGVDP